MYTSHIPADLREDLERARLEPQRENISALENLAYSSTIPVDNEIGPVYFHAGSPPDVAVSVSGTSGRDGGLDDFDLEIEKDEYIDKAIYAELKVWVEHTVSTEYGAKGARDILDIKWVWKWKWIKTQKTPRSS